MEKINYFSKNLKTWLFAHDFTYAVFGEKLKLTGVTIGKWINENRPPKMPTLITVCQIIGISPDEMIEKDLTYQILSDAKYIESVAAESSDRVDVYQENAKLARLLKHLSQVQDELKNMVAEGEKVLESVK